MACAGEPSLETNHTIRPIMPAARSTTITEFLFASIERFSPNEPIEDIAYPAHGFEFSRC
jgi:hypothetical protein